MQKYKGTPELAVMEPRHLAVGKWLNPYKYTYPTCYLAVFGRSRSNGAIVIK